MPVPSARVFHEVNVRPVNANVLESIFGKINVFVSYRRMSEGVVPVPPLRSNFNVAPYWA